tara:strand:+ start:3890 stop:4360 length:471 start_codon:yes stop_codon:yes gene_type:complete
MSGQINLKAASLGGQITLTPTDTASNLVVTIPAGTSTLVTNATLPTQLNASGSAPIYACRAWVNFNGTGTVAIRASGNVTSITDNGTGDYTVNFTTAMQDVNYAVTALVGGTTNAYVIRDYSDVTARTVSAFRISTISISPIATLDAAQINLAIFR